MPPVTSHVTPFQAIQVLLSLLSLFFIVMAACVSVRALRTLKKFIRLQGRINDLTDERLQMLEREEYR